jgi:hypothetical protein
MKIQGVRLQGTKLVPSGVATDEYFNLVSLLLPGNGTNGQTNNTFLDSSTNNFTITRNGNTTQGTFSPFSQTGWSGYFDRTGQLDVPESAISGVGSSNFSIECWVYATTQTNTFAQGLVSYGVFGSTSGTSYISFQLSSSGNLAVAYATGAALNLSDPSLFPINQWVHAVVCRSGSTLSLFVNGTRVATTTTSATVGSSGDVLAIGGQWFADVSTRQLQGYISNVRIVNGSSAYDATASTLTVPTAPLTAITNTSLLTCQSNRFIDNSSNAFAITVGGNTAVQAFAPFDPATAYAAGTVGGSAYFDGSGDFLTIPSSTAFNFGTGNFTIQGWVYMLAYTTGPALFGTTNGSTTGYYVNLGGDVNSLRVTSNASGSWTDNITVSAGNGVKLNEWTHIALVRSGSSLILYKNGVNVASTSSAASWSFSSPNNAGYIGRVNNGVSTQELNGYISGLKISNAAESISVPTVPPTSDGNTVLLTNYTNGGITDAAAKGVLETAGGAGISTAQSKFGGSSIYLDGTGDYLTFPSSQGFAMGTGDFTFEGWVYATGSDAADATGIFQQGTSLFPTSLTNSLAVAIRPVSATIRWHTYAKNTFQDSTATVSLNTWYHFAFVRNGTTTTLYIDGSSVITVTSDNTDYTGTFLGVGSIYGTVNTNWEGYINDLRITKGYARYTANFTAPTAAFPTQ